MTRRSRVTGSLLGAGLVAAVQLGHGGALDHAGFLVAGLRVLEGLHLLLAGSEPSAVVPLHVPLRESVAAIGCGVDGVG